MMSAILDYILNIDRHLFVLINSQWTSSWADAFFPAITDLHKTTAFKLIVVPLVLALMIWRRGLKKGVIIFVFCVLSILASDLVGNRVFKKNVQRLRPAETVGLEVHVRSPFGGYSFVSNHATNMFSFASFTSAFFPPVTVPAYTLAALICYSRVYNGVHFPTDVFCGALLGWIFGYIFSRLCQRVLKALEEREQVIS